MALHLSNMIAGQQVSPEAEWAEKCVRNVQLLRVIAEKAFWGAAGSGEGSD